jgi:AraC-like DNA-binding protein
MEEFFEKLNISINYFVERKDMPSWNLPRKVIDFHNLTYVISGTATYIVNNVTYELKSGDFIYIKKGESREAFTSAQKPLHCYAFNFLCDSEEFFELPLQTKFRLDLFPEIIILYEQFNKVWLERKAGYKLEARGALMIILYKIIYFSSIADAFIIDDYRVKKVKDYIIINFNKKISINTLSAICNLNPVYFGAYFKKKVGITVKEYINKIRTNKAEELLISGEYSVSEAAYSCGYEDIFYFSKVYKKFKGFSPSNTNKH